MAVTVLLLTAMAFAFSLLKTSTALRKEEIVNKEEICFKDGSFKMGCNLCTCVKDKVPTCTKMACPTSPPTQAPGACTKPRCSGPDTACLAIYQPVCGFKVDFLNFINSCQLGGIGCRQGYRYYSDGPCKPIDVEPGIPFPLPPKGKQIVPLITEGTAKDENGICKFNAMYPEDCNMCYCVTGSAPSCTKKTCAPQESQVVPLITEENVKDENGTCKFNASYPSDCNMCYCVAGSAPTCTLKACPPQEPCILPPCAVGIYFRCSDIYDPVCGIRVQFKTFSNACELGGEGCREGYMYFKHGKCEVETPVIH